jgi:uncharacterized protein with WD repeat
LIVTSPQARREGKSTTIAAHSGTVRSVNFASNGRMLMSSSDDKTIKVWALPTQRFMFTLSGHSNWVRTAQFSPDCRLSVSGSDDKSMRVWDIQSKRLLRSYDEHGGVINSVAFHPDGTCVASAGTDKVIKVWDIRCASARSMRARSPGRKLVDRLILRAQRVHAGALVLRAQVANAERRRAPQRVGPCCMALATSSAPSAGRSNTPTLSYNAHHGAVSRAVMY